METIFALATAQGKAGVAVVRISGADARSVAEEMCGPLPEHGRSVRRVNAANGDVLDEALVLTFAAGRSFTGESVVELPLHGSTAIIAAVLAELGARKELRMAEAGEFTRRALENGRLDLAQVEGLADLIDAETEAQRRQAQRVFSGALGEKSEGWRASLLRAAALIEATIDFADEEVPVDVSPEVVELLSATMAEMRVEAEGVGVAERIRSGFEVAIVGPPNAGKSTLLNRLAGRDAAITSEIAGTTRDVIEVRLDLQGLPVTFLDTAGVRESEDTIERIGIARAIERAEQADLRIHLLLPGGGPIVGVQDGDVVAHSKVDLVEGDGFGISAVTGQGIDALIGMVGSELRKRTAHVGIAMRERHRIALLRALDHLGEARVLLESGAGDDIVAEEIRSACRAVDQIVGRVDVEQILGEIFSSFCIGK